MDFLEGHVLATLGLVLIAALFAGMLADYLRLPKVTAYLLVGILLGPSSLDLLEHQHVQALHPITQLAMALVLFDLGCHFPLASVRRIARRVVRLSAGELIVTFGLVGLGLMACGQDWPTAWLLAGLALATAPATTILVLKETEAEGQVTSYAGALVILNNFVAIVLFELIFLAIHLGQKSIGTSMHVQLGRVAVDLVGSLSLGILTGLIISFACELVSPARWMVLLVAAITSVLGVAETLGIPSMLSFLAMGLTVASTSDSADKIVAGLNRLTVFLCVVFFVLHGAELQIGTFLDAGLVGAAYIALRLSGKYFGIRLAGRWWGESQAVQQWLGPSFMAQAGAAIALASIAVERDPDLGQRVQTIILGTVVFFEIVGPLVIRHAVLRAGEVPLARAVRHASTTPVDELRSLATRILVALGRDPLRSRQVEDLRVGDFVRRNVQVLNESADFDDVIAAIEHGHEDTYPVLDANNGLTGIIRSSDLSRVAFDRGMTSLINAHDLARPVDCVFQP